MNVRKEAARDAEEYARAQMFYGEGAGNRRKLISTTVKAKAERNPVYAMTFTRELDRQDMAEHAQKARKERKRIDVTHAVNKNVRSAASGDYTGLNASVLIIGAAVYWAHKTGYDKVVIAAGRRKYDQIKAKIDAKRAEHSKNKVHNISSVN